MFSIGESPLSDRYITGLTTQSPSIYSSSTRSCSPSSSTQHDGSLESVNSVNIGLGSRSPGKFSLRGRNMKEYEEQLSHLKNENFSLKLRVYFLEESIGQKGMSEDKEDLCRVNMELKVETEALKKELYEKQELVRQASILLSTLEDQYREKIQRVQTDNLIQKEHLQERIYQLEKIEPQIEVRMQEIIERDRIIEEKMEQLEHQNKILVEIQITLDEQQKQNAELEANLSQIKQVLQEKIDQLDVACGTVKELAEKLMVVEKENNKLKKDLNRKEKKVQDLKAELKESMEMVRKSNLDGHIIYKDDGVKEMAEDEHEGLWAELEIRKREVDTLRKEKQTAQQEFEARMLELKRRAAFAERLLIEVHAKESHLNSYTFAGLDPNSEKIRQLQGKLLKDQESITNLDLIKEILQGFNFDKNIKPEAISGPKETKEKKDNHQKDNKEFPSDKPQPNSGFSTLENAMFANMGQKVYNTSQTFNTYVLSGSNEEENGDGESGPQVIPCGGTELYEKTSPEIPINSNIPQYTPDVNSSLQEAEVKKLCAEMVKIKWEAKALREDREIITEKLNNLQNVSKRASVNKSFEASSHRSRIPIPSKQSHHVQKKMPNKPLANNFQGIVEDLKNKLIFTRKVITLQMFDLTSKKYRDSVQKCKMEICSLRKRLADSHNACDILRTRLEELVEFLEQIVDMDRKGIINLSSWTPQRRATLHKTLNDSRALSHSLSQSLMIGMESVLGDVDDTALSLVMDRIPQEIDMTSIGASNLNNTVDVFDMSFDLSTADSATADMIYEAIEAKMSCQMDTQVDENIVDNFSEINDFIVSKDKDLALKKNLITELQTEVDQLRHKICVTNDILYNIQNKAKSETLDRACSPLELEDDRIQEDFIKQQEIQIEQINNEKYNQEKLISEQKLLITELNDNVQSCQKQLQATVQSKQDLEKELGRVESKILCVTKENFALLVDKTNLESQLSSADAKVKFFKKDRERSVSRVSNENYEKLLGRYKAYQTAVVDLETQNERLSVDNEAYKHKSETLQDELKLICGKLSKEKRHNEALKFVNIESSYDAVESKYDRLQAAYDKVISDKAVLELRLQNLEPKLLMGKSNFNDYVPKEIPKHLHTMWVSESNKENSILKARLAEYENAADQNSLQSSMSARSLESMHTSQLDHYSTSVGHITSPKRSPNHRRDSGGHTILSPHRRQLHMESFISLGDSQLSDRNVLVNASRLVPNSIAKWQKGIQCTQELCTDPSHSQLAMRNEELQQYNTELEESLRNTKVSLKDTLESVTTAKEKQESVERAIYKQLDKTHNVLRRAKGNLRRNVVMKID